MRLDGSTLATTQSTVGLSAPTIIAAVKAFHTGGWDAVDVAARGRPRKTSPDLDSELAALNQRFLQDVCLNPAQINSAQTTLAGAGAAALMNVEHFASWLQTHEHPLSRSASVALLNRWGLQPENRYRLLREHVSTAQEPSQNQWLTQHDRFVARHRRSGAQALWIASRSLPENRTQIYGQDLRGRSHWCLVNGAVTAEHYLAFLQALATELDQPMALVFHNAQLPRITQLASWLADTHTPYICVDVIGSAAHSHLSSGSNMTEKPDAAPAARQPAIDRDTLTHLQRLEAESIHIMREVVAEAENPVMLYSIGKDSAVMLHLALKAFYPAVPPFPLLHVDTTWKFQAMYEFRETIVKKYGLELLKHTNPEGLAQKVNPFTHGSSLHTDIMKTQALKQALDEHKFDFAFGGARRDEEKSRAKERVFSFRNAQHRWDAKNQRPELWKLYNARKRRDESIRVFPLSNWTELDIWQYIYKEDIPIVPLYLAAERPVVERDGALIMVDDDRMPLNEGEVPQMRNVRFRTLGCYPLTGAVESTATTLEEVIQEMLLTRTSERQGRMIDHDSAASMEKKKQEGYF